MSHINFDFLTESFLFGYGLEDNFSALSDYELEKELNRYREYVISNMGEICREIIFDSRKIAVTIESFLERPREELLKQLALYVDVVTISDPLFELTEKKSNSTKVMAEYYGMNSDNTIDREQLVAALKYMKESTILVVCNYVKYIPISYLHEAPMNVPITYDANNYSKSLPQPIFVCISLREDQGSMDRDMQKTKCLIEAISKNGFYTKWPYNRYAYYDCNDGIVSLDNDFQYPQGALQFVTNLNMECVNYKIQEMNCQSDCQKYLSRWPILRVKHIRYQVIMFERMS